MECIRREENVDLTAAVNGCCLEKHSQLMSSCLSVKAKLLLHLLTSLVCRCLWLHSPWQVCLQLPDMLCRLNVSVLLLNFSRCWCRRPSDTIGRDMLNGEDHEANIRKGPRVLVWFMCSCCI